jgi:hypothetical protein
VKKMLQVVAGIASKDRALRWAAMLVPLHINQHSNPVSTSDP